METDSYLRFALSLVFVIGLILMAAWMARRFDFGRLAGRAAGRRDRRLSIVEVLPLDARRRLVLVRRDATEHLILIGGATDSVVETRLENGPFARVLAETTSPPSGAAT
ncbi:MAG: flagellar biosynthetic protein FliO [Alphaproteobacteria bacterium]